MELVFLVIHIILAILLVSIILIQHTSSDGLSGLGGGNANGIISSRASANFLTKTTAILAALFMMNSLLLGNLAQRKAKQGSVIEQSLKHEKKHHHTQPHQVPHKKSLKENLNGVPVAE